VQHRRLPKHPDVSLPILGFGCMRLPTLGRDSGRLDEARASALIESAVAQGVTYLDAGYPYHGGQCEPFLGRLLEGGLRRRVQLATKLPTWLVKAEPDFERLLDEQLARLRTSTIDFYMLHGLSGERWDLVQRLRGLPALERARADGRIRHIGFSFHGSPGSFVTIADGYDWDFCQIQYNFVDEDYQAGTAGLRHAAGRRIAVFAMEPLRGGSLAVEGPDAVAAIWARAAQPRSPAEWALRWVWNHPGVTLALSGMNTPEQLEENVRVAGSARAGAMTAGELALVAGVRDVFHARTRVNCTTCGYCLPCPNGVSIPDVFSAYNTSAMFDAREKASAVYRLWTVAGGHGADRCAQCGECEPKCPQQIPIQGRLEEAHAHLVGP
jgi:predicted aldo/keto reductase-like oxidoreductase